MVYKIRSRYVGIQRIALIYVLGRQNTVEMVGGLSHLGVYFWYITITIHMEVCAKCGASLMRSYERR